MVEIVLVSALIVLIRLDMLIKVVQPMVKILHNLREELLNLMKIIELILELALKERKVALLLNMIILLVVEVIMRRVKREISMQVITN